MFKKANRLSRGEFESFFRSGKGHHSDSYQLIFTPSEEELKVAVVVPKKIVRKAVSRNRVRRQLYHQLKSIIGDSKGIYIVIVKKLDLGKINKTTPQELTDLVGRTTKSR